MTDLDELETVLNDILNQPFNEYPLSDEKCSEFSEKLALIYGDPDFRHSYAKLSNYCSDLMPDQRDMIIDSLNRILFWLEENNKESKSVLKGIGKLADHLELEGLRLNRMAEISYLSDKIKQEQCQVQSLIKQNRIESEKIKDNVSNHKKDIDNMNLQVISVLGVFSAIIVAFFGGFSYFTSVFSNLHNLPIAKAVMMTSLIGLVIFNIIVILFLALSRLLNRPLFIFKKNKAGKEQSYFLFVYIAITLILMVIIILSIVMYCVNYTPLIVNDAINSSESVLNVIDS